jgi:hypothetical protein
MPPLTSLYLATRDPFQAPDLNLVRAVLHSLDVIAGPIDSATFTAGTGFDRHVVFAGCAPHLVMQPPEDGSLRFSHVALHGPFASPRLVIGPNTVRPRCPSCRARFADWRERLEDWSAGTSDAHCATCGNSCSPHALDWRGQAISGRVLIELRNVFPGEATPGDQLLDSLRDATGKAWRYGWAACLNT